MDHIIIRTKLQAVIAKQLLADGFAKPEPHLIFLIKDGEPPLDQFFESASTPDAKVTTLKRQRLGFMITFFRIYLIFQRCKKRKENLFVANINSYPVALALKLTPNFEICTFDDGSANVQKDSLFFSDKPELSDKFRTLLARILFPYGSCHFVRTRIAEHYTIYPGADNIVSRSKTRALSVNWQGLIAPTDRSTLPGEVKRIFLGTVYGEPLFRKKALIDPQKAIEWSDLYIPHPRQPEGESPKIHPKLSKYLAETLIGHYASLSKITVAHYGSSSVIPYAKDPNVDLINLYETSELYSHERK